MPPSSMRRRQWTHGTCFGLVAAGLLMLDARFTAWCSSFLSFSPELCNVQCGGVWTARFEPLRASCRCSRIVRRAADPNFAANVGQAVDTLRQEHGQLPAATPGLAVASPDVALSIAQVPALSFQGKQRYQEFWDNFRTAVQLVSTDCSSEVVQVVQSGLYIRIRWRLLLTPRGVDGKAAAGALRSAQGFLGSAGSASPFGNLLKSAGDELAREVGSWTEPEDRTVDFNSIYELDCWNGRVVAHTLEFRSPNEDFGLLGALQGVPSFR